MFLLFRRIISFPFFSIFQSGREEQYANGNLSSYEIMGVFWWEPRSFLSLYCKKIELLFRKNVVSYMLSTYLIRIHANFLVECTWFHSLLCRLAFHAVEICIKNLSLPHYCPHTPDAVIYEAVFTKISALCLRLEKKYLYSYLPL